MKPVEDFQRARQGDQDAVGRLLCWQCRQVRRWLQRRIPRRLGSLLDADDILQQACVDAFAGFPKAQFDTLPAFEAWFARIVRRQLIDSVRTLQAHRRGGGWRRLTAVRASSSVSSLLLQLHVHSLTASRVTAAAETTQRLRDAIQQLPEHYRTVIQRYELGGEPIEVVARQLGRSVGAVFMIRARAHRLLAALLGSCSG